MNDPNRLASARAGDQNALLALFDEVQKPLRRFIYRMIAQPDAVDDILQDAWLRGQAGIASFQGEEPSLKSWWFRIASNLCLNFLSQRKKWRPEAQLIAEQVTDSDPQQLEQLASTMSDPAFRYEVSEHVAFCLSCIGRSLDPAMQAAIFLKEIAGFSNEESAGILGMSEPVFRHKLAAARSQMTNAYDGLCQLINKTGRCYQCNSLREFAPEGQRSEPLVRIEPLHAAAIAEGLLEARFAIAREANLENGGTAVLHRIFFQSISNQEQSRAES